MGTNQFLLSFTAVPNSFKITNTTATKNPFPSSSLYCYYKLNSRTTAAPIRINLHDDDFDDEFGFNGSAKQRVWWSDSNDFDDFWDDEDDDMETEFWVFKIIKAFGWMVPAIGISLLLGTGPNPFFMALAVPLGQTAISMVIDKVWGNATSGPKPRYRTRNRTKNKRKPFVGNSPTEEKNKRKEGNGTRGRSRSYQSWMTGDGVSFKKTRRKAHKFGGWDELDGIHKVHSETPAQENNPTNQEYEGKLTRTRRARDRPLFLRLLIAVFPFFGSWTRFFSF